MSESRPKLGQLLLQNGLLSEGQLEKGLSSQAVSGARIGSNLVELGFVQLDAVAEALSIQLRVPPAGAGEFADVSSEILKVIPKRLCARFKVFPLRIEDGILHLAMLDPLWNELIRSLGSALGYQIQPYAAPQLRILYMLERHYGIRRAARYLRTASEAAGTVRDERRTYLEPTVGPGALTGVPLRPSSSEHEVAADAESQLLYLDQALGMPQRSPVAVSLRAPRPSVALQSYVGADGPPAAERIRLAHDRTEIISGLMTPALPDTTLLALFLLRGEMGVGLAVWEPEGGRKKLDRIVVALSDSEVCKSALASGQVSTSVGSTDRVQQALAETFGAVPPQAVAAVPVRVQQRVVNLLCVQTTRPVTPQELDHLRQLAELAGAAYAHLIAQKQ